LSGNLEKMNEKKLPFVSVKITEAQQAVSATL
jgi:hypothetical protein